MRSRVITKIDSGSTNSIKGSQYAKLLALLILGHFITATIRNVILNLRKKGLRYLKFNPHTVPCWSEFQRSEGFIPYFPRENNFNSNIKRAKKLFNEVQWRSKIEGSVSWAGQLPFIMGQSAKLKFGSKGKKLSSYANLAGSKYCFFPKSRDARKIFLNIIEMVQRPFPKSGCFLMDYINLKGREVSN